MRFSASALLRAGQARLPRDAAFGAIAVAWFAAVFTAVIWTWGFDPQVTLMPDELVNRQAAELLHKSGSLRMSLPFDDPEDLAHPRFWISVGEHAFPAYAPLAIYWFAFWLKLGTLGLAAIIALPASAVAAFAVGVAKLLPRDRRWLALAAPLLASPALYWLARPWMNMSPLLSCLGWAFFCWASWRSGDSPRLISYAAACVGAAAAVRPDYAAYLLTSALLVGLTAGPEHRKRVLVSVLGAGAGAVAVNLVLNKLSTGDPLLAAYQIQLARQEGGDTGEKAGLGARLLGLLEQLLVPMGVPTLKIAARFLSSYWLRLDSFVGVTLAQLTLVPLLLRESSEKRFLYVLALLVIFCFMLSRMDPTLFGASTAVSSLDHSIPRYWSPVYLFAALPPLLFLAQVRTKVWLIVGSVVLTGLSFANAYDLGVGTRWSLVNLRRFQDRKMTLVESLAEIVPKEALVYTETHDKVLWRKWRVGTVVADEPRITARSIRRAKAAGLDIYVFEPFVKRPPLDELDRALRRHGLRLERVPEIRGLSHVKKLKRRRR